MTLPPRSQSSRLLDLRVALSAVLAIAALLVFAGCSDEESDSSAAGDSSGAPSPEDPGPVHVHGLGVDPADKALFIASHTGLFRLPQGGQEPERVADRYQDTMAFTIVGPRRFLGSGHPDGREDLPPFLGLIESQNAGETWEEISLMGEVDFHLLVAQGQSVYGFGSEWEGEEALFLASSDGGRTWDKRPVPAPLIGLALSPEDPRVLVASSPSGLLFSRDGAASWQSIPGSPGLLAWPAADELYLANAKGLVSLSSDQGNSWEIVGLLPDAPAALGSGESRLLAATHSGEILESSDGGSSWEKRFGS